MIFGIVIFLAKLAIAIWLFTILFFFIKNYLPRVLLYTALIPLVFLAIFVRYFLYLLLAPFLLLEIPLQRFTKLNFTSINKKLFTKIDLLNL
jgi:hypothetical protein